MRFLTLSALLPLLLSTAPLTAQVSPDAQFKQLNNRLSAIESQMRAVQRQVFPGGDKRFFQPEIAPATANGPGGTGGTGAAGAAGPTDPAGASLLVQLNQRIGDLEQAQRTLTGQLEEVQHRLRQLESRTQAAAADAPPIAPPAAAPAAPGAAPAAGVAAPPAAAAAVALPGGPEQTYRAAYSLYTDGKYPQAADALEKFVAENPKSARAADAQFWAGRAMLAQGRTADAAKAFLTGYQQFPTSDRAHNSLYWLSRALVDLNQPKAACQSLDQLKSGYPKAMTGQFATDVTALRSKAKCS